MVALRARAARGIRPGDRWSQNVRGVSLETVRNVDLFAQGGIMNLVIGATGIVGGEVCRRLAAEGRPVRALVRTTSNPERVEMLRGMGVEVVTGDLKAPDSIRAACRDVDAAISTAATTISRQPDDNIRATDLEGQKTLVDTAVEAGIQRFVYVSVASMFPADNPFIGAKRAVEEHIAASGVPYTVLGPIHFMEVWLGPFFGWDPANARARTLGPGDRAFSWISVGDVAEFCIRSTDADVALNRRIDIGGPEALTAMDVVRILEDETGRRFEVEQVPVEALRQQREAARDEYDVSLAALALTTATGEGRVDMTETAPAFGVSLTSVRDFVRRSLAHAGA
jgi:uncharacterized protein YbjT (DUF2867 family)